MSPSSSRGGQRPQDVGELVARFGGRRGWQGGVNLETSAPDQALPKGLAQLVLPERRSFLHRYPRPRQSPVRAPATKRQAAGRARLSWPGRMWEPGHGPRAVAAAVETVERAWGRTGDAGRDRDEPGAIVTGRCPEVAHALADEGLAGQVDLVYVDPPFASQAAYVHEARLDGPARRARRACGRVRRPLGRRGWRLPRHARAAPRGARAAARHPRDALGARRLARVVPGAAGCSTRSWGARPSSTRSCGVARPTWAARRRATSSAARSTRSSSTADPRRSSSRPRASSPSSRRPSSWDGQGRPFTSAPRGDYTDASIERLEQEGRVHRTPSGKVYIKYFLVKDAHGVWCRERRVDALWTDVPPLRHASPGERTGFPTQKPRSLLDRILTCATPAGGLVVDVFGGSGTTGESAHALGRRFVLGDASPLSIAMRAGAAAAGRRAAGAAVVRRSADGDGAGAARGPRCGARGSVTRHAARAARAARLGRRDRRRPTAAPSAASGTPSASPARRSRPPDRAAVIERARGPLCVRVWYDDGRVGTAKVAGSNDPPRSGARSRRVRVEPRSAIVEKLMDTPEVQRLRRVRQLGVTSLAFPGAEHSRFAHAIGAAFVMKLLLVRLRAIHGALPAAQRVTEERAREALAAAFLHDLGHGPLSHLFEDAIPGTPVHETWTERIVLDPSTGVHQVLASVDASLPGARGRAGPRSPRAGVPRQGGQRRVRRRPLRLSAARRARHGSTVRRSTIWTGCCAAFASRRTWTPRAHRSWPSTAPRVCRPSRRSSQRASSCSSRSTCTRRRARPSG